MADPKPEQATMTAEQLRALVHDNSMLRATVMDLVRRVAALEAAARLKK